MKTNLTVRFIQLINTYYLISIITVNAVFRIRITFNRDPDLDQTFFTRPNLDPGWIHVKSIE